MPAKYGVGCKLLEKMGWTVTERNMKKRRVSPWEQTEQKTLTGKQPAKTRQGYPGFALGSYRSATVNTTQRQEQDDTPTKIDFLGYVNLAAASFGSSDAERPDPTTFLSQHLPQGSPAYHIERCRELHRIATWRDAMMRRQTVAVDTAPLDVAALLTALPDIQERRGTVNVTGIALRGRSQHEHGNRGGRKEEGNRNSANAYGCCHAAIGETQTEAELFRKAGQKWRGEFPDEAMIKRCHDGTHPSFPVTWRRVPAAAKRGQ
jgi:hypothetical protein